MVHSPDPRRGFPASASSGSTAVACRNQASPSRDRIGFSRPARQIGDPALRTKPARPQDNPWRHALRRPDANRARISAAPNRSIPPLTIFSRGATLIVGQDAARVCACAERLAPWLECLPIVLADGAAMPSIEVRGGQRILVCRRIKIGGHFGAFRVKVIGRSGWADLDRFIHGPRLFDLVLDLTPGGVFEGERIPRGVFAVGGREQRLAQALLDLPESVGVFEKARLIERDPDPCGHAHSGLSGCRRCLQICPCGAVETDGHRPRLDPLVCEGCAACASVCPAGRMRFTQLPHEDLLTALRLTLESHQRPGIVPVPALFQGEPGSPPPEAVAPPAGIEIVPLNVPEIGCIGMETLLTALAYGAGGVLVWLPADTPRRLRNNLKAQIHWAGSILEGLGRSAHSVCMRAAGCGGSGLDDFWPAVQGPAMPAGFSPFHNKRTLVRLAVEHLAEQSGIEPYAVALPADAPFGTVVLDHERCSCCRACVDVCAHQALQWDSELQALKFVEARCTQCGLCAKLCPEKAIESEPRYLYARRISEMPVVLNSRMPIFM